MATTVRLEEEVKRELDRLQGELLAERGERVSHSELLARLLRFARRDEEAFLASGGAPRRATRAEIEALLARAPVVKASARARDVDRALYEERP